MEYFSHLFFDLEFAGKENAFLILNTFPVIEQNPYEFTNMLHDNRGLVPEIGEQIEL